MVELLKNFGHRWGCVPLGCWRGNGPPSLRWIGVLRGRPPTLELRYKKSCLRPFGCRQLIVTRISRKTFPAPQSRKRLGIWYPIKPPCQPHRTVLKDCFQDSISVDVFFKDKYTQFPAKCLVLIRQTSLKYFLFFIYSA